MLGLFKKEETPMEEVKETVEVEVKPLSAEDKEKLAKKRALAQKNSRRVKDKATKKK